MRPVVGKVDNTNKRRVRPFYFIVFMSLIQYFFVRIYIDSVKHSKLLGGCPRTPIDAGLLEKVKYLLPSCYLCEIPIFFSHITAIFSVLF